MKQLKEILRMEIPEFKAKGEAFLSGELKKMAFKKESGGFGVYAHRDQKHFMIRLRILSGVLSKEQLRQVEKFANQYSVPRIHFTTRQAIQYHGISIESICHIMEEGLDVNLYTRGAGGNYPRNVAMSPLSGVEQNEVFDVLPYAIAANAYFLQRINTYHLPRKLKVSFSNGPKDTAHCTVQDLGFIAEMQEGKPYFRVYSGGGLGQNSRVGVRFKKLHPVDEVLYILEAMVHLFEEEGDYENHSRARVRYIADRMGDEAYEAALEAQIEKAKAKGGLDFEVEPPKYLKRGIPLKCQHMGILPQKQEGLYSYYLHPIGGQLDEALLHKINELIEPMEEVYGRLSMEEGIYLINLNGEEAEKVAQVLAPHNHIMGMELSSSCIGVPTCQIGLLESQTTLRAIVDYFNEKGSYQEVLPPVYISGCGNSCGAHQIAAIGLAGKKKKIGDEMKGVFDVYMDGCCEADHVRLGTYMGEVLQEKVPECFFTLAEKIAQSKMNFTEYVIAYSNEIQDHLKAYRE